MASKRELIEPNPGDKRYVRRDENGRFTTDQVDVGRSLAADRRQHARPRPSRATATRATADAFGINGYAQAERRAGSSRAALLFAPSCTTALRPPNGRSNRRRYHVDPPRGAG